MHFACRQMLVLFLCCLAAIKVVVVLLLYFEKSISIVERNVLFTLQCNELYLALREACGMKFSTHILWEQNKSHKNILSSFFSLTSSFQREASFLLQFLPEYQFLSHYLIRTHKLVILFANEFAAPAARNIKISCESSVLCLVLLGICRFLQLSCPKHLQ